MLVSFIVKHNLLKLYDEIVIEILTHLSLLFRIVSQTRLQIPAIRSLVSHVCRIKHQFMDNQRLVDRLDAN